MALKTISVLKSEIKSSIDKRLNPKYFLVKKVFNKLKDKSVCEVKTLNELKANITSGSYIDRYIKPTEGISYIRVGNIKPFTIDEQSRSLVFVSKNVSEKIKTKQNDIVLGRTQATAEKLGVASLIDKTNEGSVISQHISKITVNKKTISPYYLIAYLNSKFYKAQTDLSTHGDTRVEMTHSQLKEIKVFIPEKDILNSIELKVKKIISNNRGSINNIKLAKEVLKSKLDIQCKSTEKYFSVNLSTIQTLGLWNGKSYLPKYMDVENEIKDKFKTIKLNKIAGITKGIEVGSKNYNPELLKKKGDYAFIRTSDIINNEIDIFPDYFISNHLVELLDTEINNIDILFSKDGIIGETAMVSKYDKIIVASGFAKIKLNPKAQDYNITPEYLFTVLSGQETGFYPAIRRTVTASTIPHLSIERLKEIEIPIVDKLCIDKITKLIMKALKLRDEKKKLIIEVKNEMDSYFDLDQGLKNNT